LEKVNSQLNRLRNAETENTRNIVALRDITRRQPELEAKREFLAKNQDELAQQLHSLGQKHALFHDKGEKETFFNEHVCKCTRR
jgi:aminopeptidase C